ncbi:PDZ domain-containing protein [Paraburkholderia sp. BR14320]|uniref:PDZ domain-containing protein n=1 Tax=unclassified Paraburkholderia TaxID=2615204 RepID=UPI0034CDBDA4
MKKTLLASMVGLSVLTGCANGFSDYYHGMSREQIDEKVGARAAVEPKTIHATDVKAESERLAENGYWLAGESSFQGRETRFAESSALTQARKLGAEIVVLASGDAGSESVAVPIVTPTTSTTYSSFSGNASNGYGTTHVNGFGSSTSYGTSTNFIPMTVHRANYYAGYWVKQKPAVLGVTLLPLNGDQHRTIGTNSGLLVRVVVIGSPAYKADIFQGDYLMAINGEPTSDVQDALRILRAHAGQSVKLSLLRNGTTISKDVQLANGSN